MLTAVVLDLVAFGGYAHNDGPAFALTTGCLLVGARLLRRGLSPARLAAAAAVASGAALARASSAVAAAVVASIGVAAWRASGGWGSVVASAAGGAGVVGAAVAVSSGWFYWRNQRLYGTATADEFLLEGFGRSRRGSVVDVLIDEVFYRHMWSGVYGSVHPRLFVDHAGSVVVALLAVAAVGLAIAIVPRWRGRGAVPAVAAAPTTGDGDGDGLRAGVGGLAAVGVAGWLILGGYCVGLLVATARFVAEGGSGHPRYLLSLVPVLSALLAWALAELPWPRVALPVLAGGLLAVTASQFARSPDLIADPRHVRPFVLASAPAAAQAVALGAVGVALVGLATVMVSGGRGGRLDGRRVGAVAAASEHDTPDLDDRRHADEQARDGGDGDHLAGHGRPGDHRAQARREG